VMRACFDEKVSAAFQVRFFVEKTTWWWRAAVQVFAMTASDGFDPLRAALAIHCVADATHVLSTLQGINPLATHKHRSAMQWPWPGATLTCPCRSGGLLA
jgi:hypothetical protein